MFINVEPAEFFMYRVKLIFDLEKPDTEDQQVRDYLTEHELEPKYSYNQELEERQCEIMQFGGCYLGRHLNHIGQLQRTTVEVELLTAEIESLLSASAFEELLLPEERRQETIATLVEDFHQESSFKTDENGELTAVLDGEEVKAAARRQVALA